MIALFVSDGVCSGGCWVAEKKWGAREGRIMGRNMTSNLTAII